jgi:hypothetical protein
MNDLSTKSQTNSGCAQCGKDKAPYNCGICKDALCKSCVQFLEEGAFQYMTHRPEKLSSNCYCNSCFNTDVSQALASYEENYTKAQEILVFDKSQSKETRFVKRFEKPLVVPEGLDQHDITMRLAYMAAEKGYNSIVDVDIKAVKVRDGSYQTTAYSGKAIPANVSDRKLLKDRSLWSNPN